MSERYQGEIFTYDSMEGLAELVSKYVQSDTTVTVAFTPVYDDGISSESEYYSHEPETGDALALIVIMNEKHINAALDEVHDYDDWDFDSRKNPVIMFSVGPEDECHGIVSVAIAPENSDHDTNEAMVLTEMKRFIDENLCDGYAVYTISGSLFNPNVHYLVFYDE